MFLGLFLIFEPGEKHAINYEPSIKIIVKYGVPFCVWLLFLRLTGNKEYNLR